MLLKHAPSVPQEDIVVTSSGTNGPDLMLSLEATKTFPFVVECKNVEKIQIWEAFEQAKKHAEGKPHLTPIVFFRRNKSRVMVCLDAEAFLVYFMKQFGDNKIIGLNQGG